MRKTKQIVFVLTACALALALCACGSAAKLQSYDFGDDSIPSINSIIGAERKVSGVSTGVGTDGDYQEYTYASDTPVEDIQTYIDELQNRGWIITQIEGDDTAGSVQLGMESADNGKILLVTINYSGPSYKLDARKTEGTLTPV